MQLLGAEETRNGRQQSSQAFAIHASGCLQGEEDADSADQLIDYANQNLDYLLIFN